jgi:hypothetical protein
MGDHSNVRLGQYVALSPQTNAATALIVGQKIGSIWGFLEAD